MIGAHEKLLRQIHTWCKYKFVKGFCCWLYLAWVAGVKWGRGRIAWMGEGGHDEEVASSEKKMN